MTPEQIEQADNDELAYPHGWRRRGLILVPREATEAERRVEQSRSRQQIERRWARACEATADSSGRCDVFMLADYLEPGWWR